jgi:hypothetical protein
VLACACACRAPLTRAPVNRIRDQIPLAGPHVEQVRELFESYDSDADNSLNLNELAALLEKVGNQITALPATAQVASQQGKYLGHKLSKLARRAAATGTPLVRAVAPSSAHADEGTMRASAESTPPDVAARPPLRDEDASKPFRYRHLGSLAYIGNAAVFDFGQHSFMGGLAAMYAWRSIYWSEQVSNRTRALLMFDWVIRCVRGLRCARARMVLTSVQRYLGARPVQAVKNGLQSSALYRRDRILHEEQLCRSELCAC